MPTLLEATQDKRLPHSAVRMYAYVVERLAADAGSPSWPEFETCCGMTRRTVGKSLHALEAAGYLHIDRKWVNGRHAKYERNRYEVL